MLAQLDLVAEVVELDVVCGGAVALVVNIRADEVPVWAYGAAEKRVDARSTGADVDA